jgi:hypothetical protein
MAYHTDVLVTVAIFGAPMLALYNNVCRRTIAAHLHVLAASDARRKIELLTWKRLEKQQFLLGALLASMLPLMFSLRHFSGNAWSNIDNVAFWFIAMVIIAYVVVSEHYKIEDLSVCWGGGRRC